MTSLLDTIPTWAWMVGIGINMWTDILGAGGGPPPDSDLLHNRDGTIVEVRTGDSVYTRTTPANSWVQQAGGDYASVDIDFVNNRAWNGSPITIANLLACTRTSTISSYYQNADGTLTAFADNTCRYGTNGLLIEETRTNLQLQSQKFENTQYTKNASSISTEAIAAPDNTVTADFFLEDTSNGLHYITCGNVAISNATVYVTSLYAKYNGRQFVKISPNGGTDGAYFDLVNGVTGSTDGTIVNKSIVALANGWYRIVVSWTSNVVNTTPIIQLSTLGNSGGTSYQGNGASGIYIWGMQLEAGNGYVSSYIPTTGASSSRTADSVTALTSTLAGFNQLTGTQYWEMGSITGEASGVDLGGFDSGSNADIIGIYAWVNATATGNAIVRSSSVNRADFALPASTSNKMALAWALNDAAAAKGSAAVTTATPALLPVVTRLKFGLLNFGNNSAEQYYKRYSYWNTRISNANILILTT